jgi:cell wall-associated NlpC family hydrolase
VFSVRTFVAAALLAVCAVATSQGQEAAAASTESGAVNSFARSQISKPYQLGANGMKRFDCSGLVFRTFREAGLARKIGGDRRARGYYWWFKNRGLITSKPRPGDLVVWAHKGKPVSHIGIFTGYNRRGQPMTISALVNPYGVTEHRVHSINIPFKAYLRVRFDR